MNDDLIPNASRPMSRRMLLRRTATAMAGGLLGSPPPASPSSVCPRRPTSSGPSTRAGAPARAKLTDPGEAGEVLVVSGTVSGPDCRTPLPGALLDVWQADHAGLYDIKEPASLHRSHAVPVEGAAPDRRSGALRDRDDRPGRASPSPQQLHNKPASLPGPTFGGVVE